MAPTVRRLCSDSLLRNSFLLAAGTGVTALLGFGFWWLSARLFTVEQIGLGTALISGMTLICHFGLLGVNSVFIRFLPGSTRRDDLLNTGLLLVGVASVTLAAGYVLVLPWVSPQLVFVRSNPWYAVGFVALAASAAVNLLTDSVFIAYRASQYNLVVYSAMGTLKIAMPFAVVTLGAYGIFFASGAVGLLALALSAFFMITKFGYRPRPVVSRDVIRQTLRFAVSNYLADCLNVAPSLVLPMIVVNRLGAADAGYFYLAFMVANLLYAVAYAVAQSLFAEGSYGPDGLVALIRRAVRLMATVVLPAAVVLALIGGWLLSVFGRSYSSEATATLRVLALAAPGVALSSVALTILRVRKQALGVVVMNVVFAGVVIALALALAPRGLPWVAGAWLIGHLLAGGCGLIIAGRTPAGQHLTDDDRSDVPASRR